MPRDIRLASPPATPDWAWTGVAPGSTPDEARAHFAAFRRAGIGSLLLPERDLDFAALARAEGLAVHAWFWTLCRGDRRLLDEHPDWYVVNRQGESACDNPPYVDYYHFLCPGRAEVRAHVADRVAALADRDDLDGVHLDYIRYPDVILPSALWEKYDLVQHEELPAFDTCYCEVCRAAFAARHGRDPLELDDPPADEAWRRHRWNNVTALVNELADVVHGRGKQLTAAVFPTPTIARRLVRQDWPRWNLDAVLPMLYNGFYEEPVEWIEGAVAEGVAALPAGRPLYAGLYLPDMKDDEELGRAVAAARRGGADGVALFGGFRDLNAL